MLECLFVFLSGDFLRMFFLIHCLMLNLSFCLTKSNHIKYPMFLLGANLLTRPAAPLETSQALEPVFEASLTMQSPHQGDIAWSGEKRSFPKIEIT